MDLKEILNTDGPIVERWTYNCGSLRFMRIITLRGGVIRKIEMTDYGPVPLDASDLLGKRRIMAG